jgi:hypothetical protein
MVLGYLVFKEDPFAVKGGLIWALVTRLAARQCRAPVACPAWPRV